MTQKWQQAQTEIERLRYVYYDAMTKEGNAGKRRIRQTCLQRARVNESTKSGGGA